jgi:hypothetical protein
VYRAIFLFPLVALVPTVTLLAARFSRAERQPHFWLRVALLCLFIPAMLAIMVALAVVLQAGAAGGFVLLLVLLSIGALMAVESVLFRTSDSSSGDSDDSGGRGPGPPPPAPDRPSGGLPLADSEPGRWRVRDHDRPDLAGTPPRRPAREPERQPAL